MINKFFSKIKQNSEKKKFKQDLEKEHKKMFFNLGNEEKKFKKRNKINIKVKINVKIPELILNFYKKYIKYIGIFFLFLTVIALYLFINSDFFKIKTINLDYDDKSSKLLNIDMIYNSINSIRDENILFLDRSDVEAKILDSQKNITSVNVNKEIFKGTINIYLNSSTEAFYTNYEGIYYYITENGVFIPYKNFETGSLNELILSLNQRDFNFYDYKQIIKPRYMEQINDLQKKLLRNIQDLEIKKIYFFENEREVHFDVNNDLKLIFNLEYNLDEQIFNIGVFNEKNNISKIDTIIYIDLRIPNKIFYCETENRGNCQRNLSGIYDLYAQ